MNKHPQKQHRRVEAHNIATLCSEFPGKYSAPSDVYFGDIDCVFSVFKDVEIDLAVLRVRNEIAQENFDKKQQKPQPSTHAPQYKSPFRKHDDTDDAW